jgi:hypothetical protein
VKTKLGKHSIESLQNTAMLGTVHIIRCYNFKLEALVIGFTTASREVPGKKPVIREEITKPAIIQCNPSQSHEDMHVTSSQCLKSVTINTNTETPC